MEMAILLILPAPFTALIASTAALVPPIESQNPASSGQLNKNSVMYELQEAKIKIARLESILDERMPKLNAKIQYMREMEKKIEDINIEIDNLTTALSKLQMAEILSEKWIQIQLEQAVQMAELQRFVKQEIERNEFPAALANEEVVFLVASSLIVLPILSAFVFLFSL